MKVGGIRMSITATSGGFWATELRSAAGVADRAGDGEAAVDQELHQPVAQDGGVLGDGDAAARATIRRRGAGRR